MNSPCHGCGNRGETCHIGCPAYIEYQAAREQLRKIQAEEREFFAATSESCRRMVKIEGTFRI